MHTHNVLLALPATRTCDPSSCGNRPQNRMAPRLATTADFCLAFPHSTGLDHIWLHLVADSVARDREGVKGDLTGHCPLKIEGVTQR